MGLGMIELDHLLQRLNTEQNTQHVLKKHTIVWLCGEGGRGGALGVESVLSLLKSSQIGNCLLHL